MWGGSGTQCKYGRYSGDRVDILVALNQTRLVIGTGLILLLLLKVLDKFGSARGTETNRQDQKVLNLTILD